MKIPKLSLPTEFSLSLLRKKNNESSNIRFTPDSQESKRTKLLRCAIVIMAIVLGFLIVNDHNTKKSNKLPPVNSEMNRQNAANIDSTRSKQKKEKINVSMDIAAINPFLADDAVEDNIAPNVSDNDGMKQGIVHRASTASANLPVIPGYQPRPNLPQIPSRNSERNSEAIPQQQKPAQVQGIFIGGRSSMAIMSDGTVVSEGEYYNDNRISWIGGDGIHFENGESIKYK